MDAHDDCRTIGERVVERVADRRDCEPLELEPLGAVVDPSLLRVFANSDAVLPDSELHFHYCGFEICVTGTGDLEIDPREQSAGD